MNDTQQRIWDILVKLDGEKVARLFTDYYGNQLLDESFEEFIDNELE